MSPDGADLPDPVFTLADTIDAESVDQASGTEDVTPEADTELAESNDAEEAEDIAGLPHSVSQKRQRLEALFLMLWCLSLSGQTQTQTQTVIASLPDGLLVSRIRYISAKIVDYTLLV